jgi:hypothetical protein
MMKARSTIMLLTVCLGWLAGFGASNARAFSLLGPFEPWMTTTNGFSGIGGPMALGNGYRWDVPVVTYGFDQSFLDYFGIKGVAAVESAINLLNNLPPASQLNPANYTTAGSAMNFTAQSQLLVDLQSETLFLLLEHLGLASPDTYCYVLRNFMVTSPPPGSYFPVVTGDVLNRNYDPITDTPSPYVNDSLLSYILQYSVQGGVTNAFPQIYPVDPLVTDYEAAADGLQEAGDFFTGLTRDDIGGLLYLYSTNNVTYEGLPPDVQGAGSGSFVNLAFRPGVDKVTFMPQPTDPVTGAFLPSTNQFTDTYITNSMAMRQLLARVTIRPDFLFSATDMVVTAALFDRTGTTNWINYGASNSLVCVAGPGVIEPPVNIVFNKLGPFWENFGTPPNEIAGNVGSFIWGAFNGSTNPPVSFPQAAAATNGTPVRLTLELNAVPVYRWLATGTNSTFGFETSTDLNAWSTLFVITNNGSLNSYYNPHPASAQRFYRVVPQ